MANIISLANVVEALDLQSDELRSFLDPETGEIITFNEEEAHIAERDTWDNQPEWMRRQLPKIKRALQDERMLELPDRAHIDEWRMMQDFAEAQPDCKCRQELEHSVHGPGAFRFFRHTIQRFGLEESWSRYRATEMERVAREWLEENNLRYR